MPTTRSNPLDDPTADPFAVAAQAAAEIAERTGVEHHDMALTLGSGWGKAADLIGETTATIPAAEITGFSKPALEGHVGTLRSVLLPNGKRALIIGARTHYYEGHGVRRVAHSVRTAAATGATIMILTNGARGIRGGPCASRLQRPRNTCAGVGDRHIQHVYMIMRLTRWD